jgi:hypothetical protein
MVVGSYLMLAQGKKETPPTPGDASGPVLDLLEKYEPASIETLVGATRDFDANFLRDVLTYLQRVGMVVVDDSGHYRLTPLGAKARYIIAR